MFPKIPRQILILLLLYARNCEEIIGRTRFEKMLFLIQYEEFKKEPLSGVVERYDFRPYFYGPFSESLFDDIELLKSLRLVEVTVRNDGIEIYRLTRRGVEKVRELIRKGKIPPFLIDIVEKVKREWNNKSVDKLMEYIYRKFPEYTTRSKVRELYLR